MPGWAWALIVVGRGRRRGARRSGRRCGRRRTRASARPLRPRVRPYARRRARASARPKPSSRRARSAATELEIRRLSPRRAERYVAEWQRVQARFVDDPEGAVREADMLIQSVMAERGYPIDDFDQRAADISVDHPRVVENYREGHRLARANALGDGTTEDLRQAMQHYRALFDELVEEAPDEPARPRQRAGGRAGGGVPLRRRVPEEGVRRQRRTPSGIQGWPFSPGCARPVGSFRIRNHSDRERETA